MVNEMIVVVVIVILIIVFFIKSSESFGIDPVFIRNNRVYDPVPNREKSSLF